MKKKIAIISLGYLWFPCESGPSRFYQIAETFTSCGYEVECITTGFQHFKKEPRDKKLILEQNYPFKITFIDVPSYRKNIDLRRVYSNHIAQKHLKKYLKKNIGQYHAVYLSIPANNLAAMVTELCHRNRTPVVVDIEDLWPEAMSMVIKNKWIRKTLLFPFKRDAEITYRNADGIIGTSDDYTQRAFLHRRKNIPFRTVFVGCNLEDFDNGVRQYKEEIHKPEGQIWITYAGSISTSYDIRTLIDAGKMLSSKLSGQISIQILGTGSQQTRLEQYVRQEKIDAVRFWGFVPYPKMAAVLDESDIVINSFIKGAPQSIVNKIGDYLASGKPMINTLENPVFCNLVEENEVGVNVEPENATELADTIRTMLADHRKMQEYGRNARALAEKEFDRKTTYPEIVKMVELVMERNNPVA